MADDGSIVSHLSFGARPVGRRLADFEPLLPAEMLLVEACGKGETCDLSPERLLAGAKATLEATADADERVRLSGRVEKLEVMEQERRNSRGVLDSLRNSPDFYAYANAVIATDGYIQYISDMGLDPTGALARAKYAQPLRATYEALWNGVTNPATILLNFLRELPFFADQHPNGPSRGIPGGERQGPPANSDFAATQSPAVQANERWRFLIDELLGRYDRELGQPGKWGWRALVVSPDEYWRVRAEVIRFLALGGDERAPVHEHGVRLAGAHVVGTLGLTNVRTRLPLEITGSAFERQPLINGALLEGISLNGSYVPGLFGEGLEVARNMQLRSGFRSQGKVWLMGAKIGGQLACEGGVFLNRSDDGTASAIDLHGSTIGESVRFLDGFSAQGAIQLSLAKIGGELACKGVMSNRVANGTGFALNLQGSIVGSNFILRPGTAIAGAVHALHVTVSGQLAILDSTLINRADTAIGLAINAQGASVAADVIISGSTIDGGSGIALGLMGARIGGNALLLDGLACHGQVHCFGAVIGGSLTFSGATICNRTADGNGIALVASNIRAVDVEFADDFRCEGKLLLSGAQIAGNLVLYGGHFDNLVAQPSGSKAPVTLPRSADVIDLSSARISGKLMLSHEGRELHADIGGSMDLAGAHAHLLVDHPEGYPKTVQVAGDGTKIRCDVPLDGFTYDRIGHGAKNETATDAKARKSWLERQPISHTYDDFRPQPYHHLAKVLTEMGHLDAARDIRREARSRLARAERMRAKWPRKGWVLVRSFVLNGMLGGGTSFWQPLLTAAMLVALFGAVYWSFADGEYFVPAQSTVWTSETTRQMCLGTTQLKPGPNIPVPWMHCKAQPPELPRFNPWFYALDTMVPAISLTGQKANWRPVSEVALKPVLVGGRTEVVPVTAWYSLLDLVSWGQALGAVLLQALLVGLVGGWIKRE